jgi:hypothetical protein
VSIRSTFPFYFNPPKHWWRTTKLCHVLRSVLQRSVTDDDTFHHARRFLLLQSFNILASNGESLATHVYSHVHWSSWLPSAHTVAPLNIDFPPGPVWFAEAASRPIQQDSHLISCWGLTSKSIEGSNTIHECFSPPALVSRIQHSWVAGCSWSWSWSHSPTSHSSASYFPD